MKVLKYFPPTVAEKMIGERCISEAAFYALIDADRNTGRKIIESGAIPTVLINNTRKIQWKAVLAYLSEAATVAAESSGQL